MRVLVADIKQVVAPVYGLRPRDLSARRKARRFSFPRQVAMALASELTSLSTTAIGRQFDGRDHTNILDAIRRIGNPPKGFSVDLALLRESVLAHVKARHGELAPKLEALEWRPMRTAPLDGTPVRIGIRRPSATGCTIHELPYPAAYLDGRWCYATNRAPLFGWHQPARWKPQEAA